MKRRLVVLLVLTVLILVDGGWLFYLWMFPFGYSHSCDKILMFALDQYADEHGGEYPAGEATPEASLSLLYPNYANEYVLQGKTVPIDLVKTTLEKGECLGPDSCGWHYVEGLRKDDDPRLALCWDKVGLGHNGQLLSDGGHFVTFVGLRQEYIEGAKWEAFLEEQKKLLDERRKHKQQR